MCDVSWSNFHSPPEDAEQQLQLAEVLKEQVIIKEASYDDYWNEGLQIRRDCFCPPSVVIHTSRHL